jgi:hypothetical protein
VVGGLGALGVAMVGVARLTGDSRPAGNPLGTEVVVGHVDASEGEPGVRTTIGMTVLAVRTGTQEELASNGLEVDDTDATPHYIDARFANRGPNAVKRNLTVGLEDTRGNLIGRTLVFGLAEGDFRPCQSVTTGVLQPGESYESCTLALVPAGVEPGRVQFLSDNGPGREPAFVYWSAG